MKNNNSSAIVRDLEVWFVTGSQHLYGEETLKQVTTHSQEIAASLNSSESISANVVFKPVLKSTEEIFALCSK